MTMVYDYDNSLERTAALLKAGKVGVLPCDTIYGICAIADEERAERIYEIKERPLNKSFITLLSKDQVKDYGYEVPESILALWPAPLTVIVYGRDGKTHAIRVPDDEYLEKLVSLTGPIWSTSVNISGHASMNSSEDILAVFDGRIDFLVKKEGLSDNAQPSTLLDCTQSPFKVVRQGAFKIPSAI